MRIDFEMTEAQLQTLMEACRPVPLIAIHCGMPASSQERANAEWAKLGKVMGFDPMTVRPTGKGDRFFSAEVECPGMEVESGVFSGCNQTAGDCPACGR